MNRRLLGQQRDKLFREALRMQLAQAGEDLKALREIADVLIGEAKAGNIQAIRELADRLDGKPVSVLDTAPIGETVRRKLTYEIVHTYEEKPEQSDDGRVIDHEDVKAIGNGRDHAHADSEKVNGDGRE